MNQQQITYQISPIIAPLQSNIEIHSMNLSVRIAEDQEVELSFINKALDLVSMKLKDEGEYTTTLQNIVSIEIPSDLSNRKSNNKQVYFLSREPGVLVDFTLSTDLMRELHISSSDMVEVYRGIWVNRLYMDNFDGENLWLKSFGKAQLRKIPVSQPNRKRVRKIVRENRN
ncbi:MAG: hypothetical protein MJZ76_07730 [Bacteroidales bacterium]|nr:hypothetical protein [Bacteroidales bacterium]